ncbi:hypothetical protein BC830DRAFT_1126044 [Chytriomyces sp. MP71]|nr:hypothetical protein BC830DRAFT_1126044 [Chytriomyces sp. MP71]
MMASDDKTPDSNVAIAQMFDDEDEAEEERVRAALLKKKEAEGDGDEDEDSASNASDGGPPDEYAHTIAHGSASALSASTSGVSASGSKPGAATAPAVDAKFASGAIVWAKVKGYPWWPGRIEDEQNLPNNIIQIKPKVATGHFPILFCGTRD